MDVSGVQWRRLLVEGFVIVVSILLAFAIDAWWDERQEEAAARQQVARVVSELQANIEILTTHLSNLDFTTDQTRSFLARFGPNPAPMQKKELAPVYGGIFSSGTLSLPNSAAEDFLSSGQLTRGDWIIVRYKLSQLVAASRISERLSVELRELRYPLMLASSKHHPILDTTLLHPVMEGYEPSEFPYDPTTLLADVEVESQLAQYAIRMGINRDFIQVLLDDHRAVLVSIEEAQGE